MKNVLVIAAHPDDEVIGCGGTIARHVSCGDNVIIIFMADGESSRDASLIKVEQRKKMAVQAASILGCPPPIFLGLPDNKLDTVPFIELVQNIEVAVSDMTPTIIYTHHHGDLNIDHRLTCQAVLTAFRPQPHCSVKRIYAFEINSSTEWSTPSVDASFIPCCFHNISDWLEIKYNALSCYASEIRPSPHSRSYDGMKHRDRWRGHSVGLIAAEAFTVLREIW